MLVYISTSTYIHVYIYVYIYVYITVKHFMEFLAEMSMEWDSDSCLSFTFDLMSP